MSYQSEITSDIAEELASEQRAISVAEFFEKNKHMLGFDSEARALVTAVKEGVDNSLDATEEAGILPDIFVEIEDLGNDYKVIIEDNGPGIVKDQIPKIFGKLLYGSRFGKRVQARGQQGMGISAAVLYSQLTSGKPAKITSKTRNGEAHQFEVTIDTDENEPEIESDEIVEWDRTRGTRIELEMEANMRARQQLHDYIKNTAVVNPHARIYLNEPDAEFKFERVEGAELPKKAEEIQPHPHGIELGTLMKMLKATDSYSIKGFLQKEFTRVGSKTADKMIEEFKDRHYGREAAWSPPKEYELDIEETVKEAVSNKSTEEVDAFAEYIAEFLKGYSRIAHHELTWEVEESAEKVEKEFDTRFGKTVRENTLEALWNIVVENRTPDLYKIIEGITDNRKQDATIEGIAKRMASKFENLEDKRDRVTRETLTEFVDSASDMTEESVGESVGERSREKIVDAVWGIMKTVPDDPPSVKETGSDRDVARPLLEGMRATDVIAPPTDCLSPITAGLIEKGLKKEFDADFYSTTTRDASVYGGDPFVVEAGIAYGGSLPSDSSAQLLRFANRVPLVYQQGACVITEAIKEIGWRNYRLNQSKGSLPQGPVVIMVHVASTNVPFTSESKDAIASVPEIKNEVERAVREVARDLKDHLNKQRSRQKRREKERVIEELLPEMAAKVSEITGKETPNIEKTIARILNKVYVSRSMDGSKSILEATNYSNSRKSFEIHTFVGSEPDLKDGEAHVVDLDGEYDVVWEVDVDKDETVKLEYSVKDGDAGMVSVDGIEDEYIEINDETQ